jgi:D-alanine transfer protein
MDASGVSMRARHAYYDRLQKEAHDLGISLVDNREYDADRGFLEDEAAHMSPVGWLAFNRALDEFVRRVAP